MFLCCEKYLAVREMQIKPTVRTYLTPFWMAKILKKTTNMLAWVWVKEHMVTTG